MASKNRNNVAPSYFSSLMLFHSLPHHNVPCSHSCLPSLPGTHCDHICYRAFALAVPSARNSLSTDFDTDGSFSSSSVAQMLPPVRGLLISLLYDSLFYNRHCYFIPILFLLYSFITVFSTLEFKSSITKASHNTQQALNKITK